MTSVLNWRVKEIDFSRKRIFLRRRTIRQYEMKPTNYYASIRHRRQ